MWESFCSDILNRDKFIVQNPNVSRSINVIVVSDFRNENKTLVHMKYPKHSVIPFLVYALNILEHVDDKIMSNFSFKQDNWQ